MESFISEVGRPIVSILLVGGVAAVVFVFHCLAFGILSAFSGVFIEAEDRLMAFFIGCIGVAFCVYIDPIIYTWLTS